MGLLCTQSQRDGCGGHGGKQRIKEGTRFLGERGPSRWWEGADSRGIVVKLCSYNSITVTCAPTAKLLSSSLIFLCKISSLCVQGPLSIRIDPSRHNKPVVALEEFGL